MTRFKSFLAGSVTPARTGQEAGDSSAGEALDQEQDAEDGRSVEDHAGGGLGDGVADQEEAEHDVEGAQGEGEIEVTRHKLIAGLNRRSFIVAQISGRQERGATELKSKGKMTGLPAATNRNRDSGSI